MNLLVKRLEADAKLPTKQRTTDEGFDLYSNREVILHPRATTIIKTGIAAMTDENHWIQIEGRSGFASKGLFPIGGIVDYTYTGDISVIMVNNTDSEVKIEKHMKIAQMVIRDRHPAEIVEVKEFELTDRGDKGFGSSGN